MSEIVTDRGRTGVLAYKDQFAREEKDVLRDEVAYGEVEDLGNGWYFVPTESVRTIETGTDYKHVPDPDHVCDDNDDCEFHEYQGPKVEAVTEQGDEPTMEDLKALTVARLQELADKEQVDLTGLKLKDDILGRMAAHFGLDPAS